MTTAVCRIALFALSPACSWDKRGHRRNIIEANITLCFASSTSHLTDVGLAIANMDMEEDITVLSDFRRLIPRTNYVADRP